MAAPASKRTKGALFKVSDALGVAGGWANLVAAKSKESAANAGWSLLGDSSAPTERPAVSRSAVVAVHADGDDVREVEGAHAHSDAPALTLREFHSFLSPGPSGTVFDRDASQYAALVRKPLEAGAAEGARPPKSYAWLANDWKKRRRGAAKRKRR